METKYHYKINDNIEGPFPKEYLLFLLKEGKITLNTEVKIEGSTDWFKISNIFAAETIDLEKNQKSNSKAALIILFGSIIFGLFAMYERYLAYSQGINFWDILKRWGVIN